MGRGPGGVLYAAAAFAGAALGLALARTPVSLILAFLANLALGLGCGVTLSVPWALAASRSFNRWGWVILLVGLAWGVAGGLRLLHLATPWPWWRRGLAAAAALVLAALSFAFTAKMLLSRERAQLPPSPPAAGVPRPPQPFPP